MMRANREQDAVSPGRGSAIGREPAPGPGKQTLVEAANPSMNGEAEVGQRPAVQPAEPRAEAGAVGGQAAGATGATGTPAPGATNAPAATYIIPFDRHPKSSPGEQIIFGAVFTDPQPNDYKLVFTGVGGDFNSAASGTKTVTVPGIVRNNLNFFIDAAWDKRTAVTVRLQLQKTSDSSVVQTESWTFAPKTVAPTTVTQREAATERALPSVYSYKCGPDLHADGRDDYLSQTVLETFQANASNLTVADVKPAYATAHGLTTDQQVTNHFFGSDAGNNGTFTVSAGDLFFDQHGGGMPDKATFEAALVAMKEIHVDLPQVYSASPGTVLGNFTVRRILKADGSKKLKKWKT
jgi:hypothetical protein